mgnify:CR=1 FL=1
MTFKTNGNFDKLRKNMTNLGSKTEVKFSELFSEDFMANCSSYSSIDEMFKAFGFRIETKEDFKEIPDAEWEVFIKENTNFDSWQEMQKSAFTIYTKKQLRKGFK